MKKVNAIIIALVVLLSFLITSEAIAITFYFGTPKVIREVRRRRQNGIWYLYPERHKMYHLYKDEAYWVDPNHRELGYSYPYNCGPKSYCPFYHRAIPEIKPPVKMPRCSLGYIFILPDVEDVQKDLYLYNNPDHDFNW